MQRTALVTGSSNGIGEAIVKALAALDYKLVVTGRSCDDVARVARECQSLSPSGCAPLEIIADLALECDVRRLFECAMQHFCNRLDLLVNNAGLSSICNLDDPNDSYIKYKRTIAVNLDAAVLLTLLCYEPLRRTSEQHCELRPTSVIFISSIAAVKPLEDFAYCVSKSALSMLSNCLAGRMGPQVRVNCINPGPVETKIIERCGADLDQFRSCAERVAPLRRIGQAREVAEAVLFLSDPKRASYISGSQLNIDGGTLCSPCKF